jgi:hypothetical protein
MKMIICWDVMPCSLYIVTDGVIGLMTEAVRNVGQFLPDYTLQHPRRQPSSNLTPSLL